jgi:anti-sigma regulatory factor (Ser/Thr protein kinase)
MADQLVLPATVNVLGDVRQFVKNAAAQAGLDRKSTYNLQLALDEIVTNVILYGYEASGLTGNIVLKSDITEKSLVITLEDTGIAYDPRTREMPDEVDLSKDLVDRPIGGLGIYLAINGVDEFNYERAGNRNINTFTVYQSRRRQQTGGGLS